MTTPTTIRIDNAEYVRADSITKQPDPDSPIRIVVAQRGWVLVGHYSEDGARVFLDNASVIRIWGTKKGLGELATSGPLANTVLDPAGHVEFHRLGVVLTIACDPAKWSL